MSTCLAAYVAACIGTMQQQLLPMGELTDLVHQCSSLKSSQLAPVHSSFDICREKSPRMLLKRNASRNGSSPSSCSEITLDLGTACVLIMKHIF